MLLLKIRLKNISTNFLVNLNESDMKKGFIISIVKVIVKYILPIVVGYFEGDTHLVEDSLVSLF